MSLFIVDVESDGPSPAEHSMVCFGAVRVDNPIVHTYFGTTSPISDKFVPEALAISGYSREQHRCFSDPKAVMEHFNHWILKVNGDGRPVFISDNPAFDWQWVNYYFHRFLGENPFGYSGRRIGDIYSGLVKDMRKSNDWKRLRVTKHTHNPVDDARGNAEALLKFKELGLEF